MKRHFLIVHDYGTGGLWAVMNARSRDEIASRYPELTVVDERPEWMGGQDYERILVEEYHDIDNRPEGWLALLSKTASKT